MVVKLSKCNNFHTTTVTVVHWCKAWCCIWWLQFWAMFTNTRTFLGYLSNLEFHKSQSWPTANWTDSCLHLRKKDSLFLKGLLLLFTRQYRSKSAPILNNWQWAKGGMGELSENKQLVWTLQESSVVKTFKGYKWSDWTDQHYGTLYELW